MNNVIKYDSPPVLKSGEIALLEYDTEKGLIYVFCHNDELYLKKEELKKE